MEGDNIYQIEKIKKLKGNQKTNPNSKEVHTHEHKRPGLTQCGDHSRRLVNMK